MTPGISVASAANIEHRIHEYDHDANSRSYGIEAAEKLRVSASRVFKTLVVVIDGKDMAVAVIPVTATLSMKLVARAFGGKKAAMANPDAVQRSTGYVLGGVSPLGQKRALTTFIDANAMNYQTIYVSAGRRGLEIELSPSDLAELTGATFRPLQQE